MDVVHPGDMYADISPVAEEECAIPDIFKKARFGPEVHSGIVD